MSIYKGDYDNINPELALKTITPDDEFKNELATRKNELTEIVTREVVNKAIEEARNDLDLKRIQRQNAINDIYNMVLSSVNSEQLKRMVERFMVDENFKSQDLKNIATFLETLTKIENMNIGKQTADDVNSNPKKDGVRMVVEFRQDEGVKMGVEHNG